MFLNSQQINWINNYAKGRKDDPNNRNLRLQLLFFNFFFFNLLQASLQVYSYCWFADGLWTETELTTVK